MSNLFEPTALVVPFEKLRMTDVESVGGKNASLGEMISQLPSGVKVPTGFATTAHASASCRVVVLTSCPMATELREVLPHLRGSNTWPGACTSLLQLWRHSHRSGGLSTQ